MSFLASWPPAALRSNARVHHMARYKASSRYREECRLLTLSATTAAYREALRASGKVRVTLTFLPPARYRYDASNLRHSAKSLLDGIQDAIGLDDRDFMVTDSLADDPVKGGAVRVELIAFNI